MPVTLLGFTLQGFSLSKSWYPLGPASSLAVGLSLDNLRTPPAFAPAPPPSTDLPCLLRAPRQSRIRHFRSSLRDCPRGGTESPTIRFPQTRTASRMKHTPFSGALSLSSLPYRSRPWRDHRQTASTPEFCSLRESVPFSASSSRPERPMPSWVFLPL